jgi:Zn-dependent M28 family amino/carboxypeptidase
MEEIGSFGSKALVRELIQERTIKSAIIYETMAYSDSAPHTQSVPKVLSAFYPGQMARIRTRGFAGDWTLIVYRNFAAHVARAFGAGLTHIAGPQIPILMRDPVDLPVLGKVLSYVVPVVNNFGRSDNHSFWTAGIPAIMITDTANFRNPNYHKPTDTPDTLDYDRLAEIVAATAIALAQLAGLVTAAGQADDSIQSSRNQAAAEYVSSHIPE